MSKIPYNHKAIEKKWRDKWEENPVNVQFDENGKKINEKLIGWRDENSRVNYKRWITIDNPREDSKVHLYNIRVNQVKYENDTSYRLVTGNAQNSRELLGGKENSVVVEPYKDFYSESTKKGGNLILGEYIP